MAIGLALPGEGGVGPRSRGDHRQGVVDGDLHVPREVAIEARHGVGVGAEPVAAGGSRGVAVERARRGDEAALARGARRQRGGTFRGGGAGGEPGARRAAREGIAPGVERQAPPGHRAGGVGRQHVAEGAVAGLPPERMEHRHRVLEPGAGRRRTGDREHDPAQALTAVSVRPVLLCRQRRRGQQGGGDREGAGETAASENGHGFEK